MQLDELIGAAYDAVLEPARWPFVMASACEIMEANLCALRVMDVHGADLMMLAHGDSLTPTLYEEYARDWLDKDIHLRKGLGTPALWNRPGLRERETATPEDERLSPFINEFLKPRELGRLTAMLWKGSHGAGSVAFHRPLKAPLLSEEKLRIGAQLQPHFMQAARMVAAQHSTHAFGRHTAMVFSDSAQAVFLLDDHARIVWLNPAAERLLKDRLATLASDGTLRLPGRTSRIIDELVGDAWGRGDFGQPPRVAIFDDTQRRIVVRGRVIGRASAPGIVFSRAAILLECAGSPDMLTAAHRLQRLFGLTQAEASVAIALAEDQSTAEIAAGRGVSDETVRSQIKAVLRKVGVARRGGLVHIVSQLSD
jgi:DNA-binding CsgD family transcriptional regulator